MEPSADKDNPNRPGPGPDTGSLSPEEDEKHSFRPSYSRRDLMWLSGLGLAIAAVIIIALRLFFININTSIADDVQFPVRGENIIIKKIDTYWRKADPEKDLGVQLNAKFLPAAEITLKSSGDGSLRFFFENPKGELVGDTVTRTFSDGLFEDTGEKTTNLHGTGGFEDLGDYNEYLTEKIDFWHLLVMEGTGPDAAAPSYKQIIRMRLSPKRR